MSDRYILMLENDSDDRYITQSTLRQLNIAIPVRYEYYSPSLTSLLNEVPSLILLAYNTVPANVIEIIRHFKNDRVYRKVPVVLLIEDLPREVVDTYYEEGVTTVIKKPFKESDTKFKIEVFFKYWFQVAEL